MEAVAGTISLEDDVNEAHGVATTFTLDTALTAGGLSVEIDGVTYSATWAGSHAQTMADFKDSLNGSGDFAAIVDGNTITVRPKDATAVYVIDTAFATVGDAAIASTTQASYIVLDETAVLDTLTGDMFSILYTGAGQSLTLSSETQADGRTVSADGKGDTILVLGFTDAEDAADTDAVVVSSGFDVAELWVLNEYLYNEFGINTVPANFEFFLEDLDSGVPVTVYDVNTLLQANLLTPGALTQIDRIVTVDQETSIQASVAFNDLGVDAEVRSLTLNLEGNSVIQGNLELPQDADPQSDLPTTLPQFFDTLTINSYDAAGLGTAANRITGNIFADSGTDGSASESLAEAFTLTLNPAMDITGTEGQIAFDGQVLNLLDTWNGFDVAAAMAGINYNNWTAVDASTAESSTFTVTALTLGQTIIINGVTVTALAAATAAQVATAFGDLTTTAIVSVSGAYGTPTGWTGVPAVTVDGAAVTFTNTVLSNADNFTTSTGTNPVVGVATDGIAEVAFTNKNAGVVTDVAIGDFTFVANNALTTGLTGTVNTDQQGVFNADENNLYEVVINADHDLIIDGELELSYVTRSNSTNDETVTGTITVNGTGDVTIGSVNSDDIHITAVTLSNNGTGTVTAPGTSPGAAMGNTELLDIYATDALSAVVLGTEGDATRPGVAGADLSHIYVSGEGDVDLGVIALVDNTEFELLTYLSSGTVTADLRADMAAGGTWTFDNGSGPALGVLNLTIFGTGAADAYPADAAYGASFPTGSTLNLDNVNLTIEGTVDLTDVTLNLTDVDIVVPAGESLALTLDQIAALPAGTSVVGEGTVIVEGEVDTDAAVALDLSQIQTVGIDLSGITNVGVIVPQANPVGITLAANAIDDDSNDAGFDVIGTDFNDSITGTAFDDTFTMGLGDDTIDGGIGNDTFNVDDGTDTITSELVNDGTVGDVLVVSAGATATATVDGSVGVFIATAATMNLNNVDDAATITGTDGEDNTIDLTAAGGTYGFTLVGGSEAAAGADTLIGSDQDDIINGGNASQTAAAAKDILTGNGGEDVFQITVDMGNTATMALTTTQANVDEETLQVTVAETTVTGDEVLNVNYTVNGAGLGVQVDLSSVDVTSVTAIAAAIATELQNNGSFIASASAGGTDTVTVTAQSGFNLEITGTNSNTNVDEITTVTGEGTDVAQIIELTATGTPTDGDVYSALATLNGGVSIAGTYNAGLGATAASVVDGIGGNFNANAGLTTIDVSDIDGDGLIIFTDENADNGGFSLVTDLTAAFGGSGASNAAYSYLTADIITDFTSGVDHIEFATETGTDLGAGSGGNYMEAAEVANATLANAAAALAFTNNAGTLQYYLTSVADIDGNAGADFDGDSDNADAFGMLYFDANLDGTADGVVLLGGVDLNSFAAFDIIVS